MDLAHHNLRLVVSIARTFRNSSLTLEEMTFAGNVGLMEATKRFKGRIQGPVCNLRVLLDPGDHPCGHQERALDSYTRTARTRSPTNPHRRGASGKTNQRKIWIHCIMKPGYPRR